MMSKQHPTTELPASESASFAASPPSAKGEERNPIPAVSHESHGQQEHTQVFTWLEALRIFVVALAAIAVGVRLWEPFSAFSLIGVVGLLIGCWPILTEAFENILARRMTMELSMLIAIVAAAAIGQFFTALIITLFVLVAEVLESLTVSRGRTAIRELLDFVPQTVTVRRDGQLREVAADTLAVGDIVLVNPGGRIPVDGTVTTGYSFVDQSRITGESLPVEKVEGASVYAGSINQSGALEIHAEQLGRDTSYGKIIEAVEEAERSRAPVQRLADRLAGYIVYVAFAAALITLLITRDLRSTISVIIVAGACGIAAGTPLAVLGAIGRAARLGAIIKGGRYLEELGIVTTVVLDKTGTLTFGEPQLQAILPCPGVSEEDLLVTAASAELRSEHPLGKTIVAAAEERGCSLTEAEEFGYTPGRGIEAQLASERVLVGNQALLLEHGITVPPDLLPTGSAGSEVFVTRAGKLLGAITVADTVRPEARAAVATLHKLGIQTVLLTGDTQRVASTVAAELGISSVVADLLPDEKRRRVQELVASGRTVAMVGDGVNDAPALTEAHVGVAMGSGTDVARESADIVLLGNDLETFTQTVALARRTRRIIWANFTGTLLVDAVGIVLAAVGILNPLLAAAVHVSSEMVFILNSARLLPVGHSSLKGREQP